MSPLVLLLKALAKLIRYLNVAATSLVLDMLDQEGYVTLGQGALCTLVQVVTAMMALVDLCMMDLVERSTTVQVVTVMQVLAVNAMTE